MDIYGINTLKSDPKTKMHQVNKEAYINFTVQGKKPRKMLIETAIKSWLRETHAIQTGHASSF